jgi:hypothetical protein
VYALTLNPLHALFKPDIPCPQTFCKLPKGLSVACPIPSFISRLVNLTIPPPASAHCPILVLFTILLARHAAKEKPDEDEGGTASKAPATSCPEASYNPHHHQHALTKPGPVAMGSTSF